MQVSAPKISMAASLKERGETWPLVDQCSAGIFECKMAMILHQVREDYYS
jgi:hypothetical protein